MQMRFFKPKPMNSDEYERLAKRISDLEAEMDKLVSKFMSLRGLIHRKKLDDEINDPELKKEDLYKGVLLKEDGSSTGH